MAAEPVSLVVVPQPYLEESPASWLMRVCHYHGVYPRTLFEALNLPNIADYDRSLGLRELEAITYGSNICTDKLVCLSSKFSHVRNEEMAAAFLQGASSEISIYRYCPECLSVDEVPYWRLAWRLAHVYYCPIHLCELLSHCGACGKELQILEKWKASINSEDIDSPCCFCPACGADLRVFAVRHVPDSAGFCEVLGLQQAITSAVIRGYFLLPGVDFTLPLRLLPRAILLGAHRNEDNVSCHVREPTLLPMMRGFLLGGLSVARNDFRSANANVWMKHAVQLRFKTLDVYGDRVLRY